MRLHVAGREYLRLTITGAPDGATFQVSVDDGRTWVGLEASPEEGVTGRVLLAGPSATGNPDGTPVLPELGDHRVLLRLADTPETVIRHAATVTVHA